MKSGLKWRCRGQRTLGCGRWWWSRLRGDREVGWGRWRSPTVCGLTSKVLRDWEADEKSELCKKRQIGWWSLGWSKPFDKALKMKLGFITLFQMILRSVPYCLYPHRLLK
jgi:hypothetical protein